MDPDREIAPHVSVVVFSCNRRESLIRCLTSLSRIEYPNVSIFIVDNGSTSYVPHEVENLFEGVHLIENEGYPNAARGRNAALRFLLGTSRTEFVLLIEDDSVVHPRLVRRLVEAHDPQRGWEIIQPAIYELEDPERLFAYGGRFSRYTGEVSRIGSLPPAADPSDEAMPIDFAFGYSLFTHRTVLESVGLFDETLFADYASDIDFCLRADKKNYTVVVAPDAILWLAEGERNRDPHHVRQSYIRAERQALLVRKHGRVHHRAAFLLLTPLLLTLPALRETVRGRPGSALAWILGLIRGLVRTTKSGGPARSPDPSADETTWRPVPGKR